jgi:hypothetical protein
MKGKRTEILKDILLYVCMPEDTTEAGCHNSLIERPVLSSRRCWLGPLKTVVWTVAAVGGPLLFCALLT